jgi:hypothetical protein
MQLIFGEAVVRGQQRTLKLLLAVSTANFGTTLETMLVEAAATVAL